MKQGSASRDGRYGGKVEPTSRAINPRAVSQIGQALSNKATDKARQLDPVENIHAGRGYRAPMRSQKTSNSGSQGSY